MKPGRLFTGLVLACAASLATAPALAQHSASGRIAATPAAASAKPDPTADALARADAALNSNGKAAPASTVAAAGAPAPASASAPASAPAAAAAAAPTSAADAASTAAAASAASASAEAAPVAAPLPAMRAALPVTTPSNGPSAAGSLLQTTLALAFVLALLVGAAWFLKRYGPKSITGGTAVKLVGALNVGARERILVVEVGEQWIVVGASPGRMNALATMPRQEGASSAPAAQAGLPSANFAEWFKQTIEKRNGK
jgi:flagellar protein FliO/FliZ